MYSIEMSKEGRAREKKLCERKIEESTNKVNKYMILAGKTIRADRNTKKALAAQKVARRAFANCMYWKVRLRTLEELERGLYDEMATKIL